MGYFCVLSGFLLGISQIGKVIPKPILGQEFHIISPILGFICPNNSPTLGFTCRGNSPILGFILPNNSPILGFTHPKHCPTLGFTCPSNTLILGFTCPNNFPCYREIPVTIISLPWIFLTQQFPSNGVSFPDKQLPFMVFM